MIFISFSVIPSQSYTSWTVKELVRPSEELLFNMYIFVNHKDDINKPKLKVFMKTKNKDQTKAQQKWF